MAHPSLEFSGCISDFANAMQKGIFYCEVEVSSEPTSKTTFCVKYLTVYNFCHICVVTDYKIAYKTC